LYIPELIRI